MDLWTAVRVVGRHWRVLLVGLVLTGVMLVGVYLRLPRQYSSTGTVIVLQASVTTNPLTSLDSSNQLAAAVVVTLADTGTSGAEVRARGGEADYSLVADPNLPTIAITTTSSDPGTAVHTVGVVAAVMNDVLLQRQKDLSVPTSTWLHVVPLDTAAAATNTGGKNKVLAIAAVLGLLAAVGLTFIAEAITGLRRRRSPSRESETSDPDAAGPRPQALTHCVPEPTPAAQLPAHAPSPGDSLSAPGTILQPGHLPSFAEYLTAEALTPALSTLPTKAVRRRTVLEATATSTRRRRHR